MKNYLKSDIEAKPFFKIYVFFLIPLIFLTIIVNSADESGSFISSIASIIQSYVSALLWFAIFGYVIKYVFYREKGFLYSGSVSEIAPKILKWYLLSIVTLGIYSPWMIMHIADYLLDRTKYDEQNGELLSSPGALLKYMLLTVYLPVFILTMLFVFFIIRNIYSDAVFFSLSFGFFIFIFTIVIILVMIPFMFYYFVWLINLRYGLYKTEFRLSMSEFAKFIIPQLLLSIITLFIYYPAAVVKIYRFLLGGTVYTDENGIDKGNFGFDGEISKGFCLIWGQGLLTLISIGFYGPWAISKVGNYWINNTWIDAQE